MDTKFLRAIKDLEVVKTNLSTQQRDVRLLEFYQNKVAPLSNFTQMSDMFHSVIRDKEEYNNLIEYEQNFLRGIQSELITNPSKLSVKE